MKFRYLKFPLEPSHPFFGNAILKPIIPIEISFQARSLRYAALVDSGADFCIFHAEIGEALGFEVRDGTRMDFGGIQDRGGAVSYLHPVTLIIGDSSLDVQVGFSYDIAHMAMGCSASEDSSTSSP